MVDAEGTFHPLFDLAEFRVVAANYVKSLIRARWKVDPGFLAAPDLKSWKLVNIDAEPHEAWELMHQAALALARLNREYLPRCDSGGVRTIDEDTHVSRLIYELAFLAQVEGGAPELNSTLLSAVASLQHGEDVDWGEIIDWSRLPAIRSDLDLLPEPERQPSTVPTAAKFVFQYSVGGCRVCYGASEMQVINRPQIGLFYIWCLIRNAPSKFTAAEMLQEHFRYSRPENFSSSVGEFDEDDEDDHIPGSNGWNERHDGSRYLNDLRKAIKSTEALLESARVDAKQHLVKTRTKEIVKLQQELQNQSWHGKSKTDREMMAKNNRDKVKKAIDRAQKQLANIAPQLSLHLKAFIQTNADFRYAPETAHAWET